MRRYLFDSGVAAEYISSHAAISEFTKLRRRQGDHVGICTPVLGELAAGAAGSNDPQRHLDILKIRVGTLRCWPFDSIAAYEFGRIRAELKRIGRPMQQIDIQVAAVAKALGRCTVVTMDTDLLAVPGLAVEFWSP